MKPENHESIETNRKTIEIKDSNGDIGREERVEFADGSWTGRGEITEGPSKGHKWMKGEGGRTEGELTELGSLKIDIQDLKMGRWGVILDQGNNPDKPRQGDTWAHAEAHTKRHPERVHEDALLIDRGVQSEADDKGRETYRLTRKDNGEVTVMLTSYDDKSGWKTTTGRHLEGPKAGHTWEERSAFHDDAEISTDLSLKIQKGSIESMKVRGFSRKLSADADQQKESPLYLKLRGDWKESEAA